MSTSEVETYISNNKIQELLQNAVNECYRAKAENPSAFLADYFKRMAGGFNIDKVVARQVIDSRGNPTVEVDVYVGGRLIAREAAPSGASTGSNEALELRDKDPSKFMGKSVYGAIENVNTKINAALQKKDVRDLAALDKVMCDLDGTELKNNLGGNSITATSFALAHAGANISGVEMFQHLSDVFHKQADPNRKYKLPTPMVNILNGGKHAGGKLKIQEFMIVPRSDVEFTQVVKIITEVYHHLGKILTEKYGVSAKNLGDEGGYAPSLDTAEEALSVIEEAIQKAGYTVGEDVKMAIDAAASEFFSDGKYEIEEGKFVTSAELVDYYAEMVEKHPGLCSIEDPMDEKDYNGFIEFTKRLGDKVMVVGDDVYTTNTNLIKKGIEEKWANALLLKVNQIGTISEAMEAARMEFGVNQEVVVSHRSGETPGSLISDLVVAIGANYIKTGAPARGERVAKYNRLLQIEDYLKEHSLLQDKSQ